MYSRLARQCAMTEYAPADIKQKVLRAGLGNDAAERLVGQLMDEGYVNEERYVYAFVHDKFELCHWGRRKIAIALAQKGLRGNMVQSNLAEINEAKYLQVLGEILRTKNKQISAASNQERFQKLLRFAASRGFELPLAYQVVEQMIESED